MVMHQPVLVAEVVKFLDPRPGAVMVDATCGGGGHSAELLPRLRPDGRLVAMDRDADALAAAGQRLREFETMTMFAQRNFCELPAALRDLDLVSVDGLVVDLGLSSLQLDDAARGFSFLREGPLDMRMDRHQTLTAEALISRSTEEELAQLIGTLGEERYAGRIARRIVRERREHSLTTTNRLADVIADAVPPAARHGRLHPATRTFQALRMAVNDELGALAALLKELPDVLAPHGRAVIIAFHSLEDRLVKQAFRRGQQEGQWEVLTKRPVRPGDEEVAGNSRARSAKLRAIEKMEPHKPDRSHDRPRSAWGDIPPTRSLKRDLTVRGQRPGTEGGTP